MERRTFEAIRNIRPTKLYIAADGPTRNKAGEKDKCNEARRITEYIDWPCDVKRLYRKNNLGCGIAVSRAIDWFFDNVEMGIILEDDCLPNPSFFKYCELMLDLYKNDPTVMCISGDNFLPKEKQKNTGYYFSKYAHIWGWASWKRAWKGYDVEIKDWPIIQKSELFNKYFDNLLEKRYWNLLFTAAHKGKIDTWDYQFIYHIWKNNGLSITPGTNLISNIGFSKKSLHTKLENALMSELPTYSFKTPFQKMAVKRNQKLDNFERNNVFKIKWFDVFIQQIYYLLK